MPDSDPNFRSAAIPPTPTRDEYLDSGERDLSWLSAQEPIALFEDWLAQAGQTESHDPNAMSLATADENGVPDVRIVLLKGLSEAGLCFFTNSESAKGAQLKSASHAALCFHWKTQKRQVRVRGTVAPVSEAESDRYFAKRARGSQIGAWASDQSRPVASREAMIDAVQEVERRFAGKDVPRPDHWYGWCVAPTEIEFWQDGAFRLHDRLVFRKSDDRWNKTRLYP